MSDYADLKARLSIKADMIQLGEKIEWGSDSAIMREAAAAIDALERKCADLIAADRDHAAATAGMKRRLEARAEAAEALVKRLEEALLWCSGSNDFNEGGVAEKGWLKICAPILAALQEDKSHE